MPRRPRRVASPAAVLASSLLSPPPPEPAATSAAYAPGSHVSPTLAGGAWGTAGKVSAALVTGLVAAGGASRTPQLWYACFGGLLAGLAALIVVGSLLVVGACVSFGVKMQPAGRATPGVAAQTADSMLAMVVFAALAAWPAAAFARGDATALVFSLAEAMPGVAPHVALPLYLLQLVVLTLVVDGYSHFKHKAMHTSLLFEFHKLHHLHRDPSPWAAFAVHPVEAFLTFVPVLGMLSPAMPVWAHAYALWTLAWFFINLYLHSGYEIDIFERVMAPLWINTSGYHNFHHELMYTNYSELLYLWDWLCDTGFHPTGYGYGRSTPKFGKIRPRL